MKREGSLEAWNKESRLCPNKWVVMSCKWMKREARLCLWALVLLSNHHVVHLVQRADPLKWYSDAAFCVSGDYMWAVPVSPKRHTSWVTNVLQVAVGLGDILTMDALNYGIWNKNHSVKTAFSSSNNLVLSMLAIRAKLVVKPEMLDRRRLLNNKCVSSSNAEWAVTILSSMVLTCTLELRHKRLFGKQEFRGNHFGMPHEPTRSLTFWAKVHLTRKAEKISLVSLLSRLPR